MCCLPSSAMVSAKSTRVFDEGPDRFGVRGIVAKPTSSSGCMQVNANGQALPKVNGSKVGLKAESQIVEVEGPLATIFLAAEKQFALIDWKARMPDMLADSFWLRKIMQDGMFFRQNFSIRPYEIGQIKQLP